jgi:hypothetical protein
VRKLISFDDETFTALTGLGRSRMATIQDLADEAFADLLKKHGVPLDLRDALRKSVKAAGQNAGTRKTSVQTPHAERVRAATRRTGAKRKAG